MVTKDLNESKPLKIVWLEVEPRHYAEAQERKKAGKESYNLFVLSLVFAVDGVSLVFPTPKQTAEITAAFEEKFGPRVEGPKE